MMITRGLGSELGLEDLPVPSDVRYLVQYGDPFEPMVGELQQQVVVSGGLDVGLAFSSVEIEVEVFPQIAVDVASFDIEIAASSVSVNLEMSSQINLEVEVSE